MSEPAGTVLSRIEGHIGHVTLSNLRRRNAISVAMLRELGDVLVAFEADRTVRVVVLAGESDVAFASGGDISQFGDEAARREARRQYEGASEASLGLLHRLAKPTIAAIRGYCFGGGIAVAALCDLRIAGDDAVFSLPPARLGLAYTFFGIERLVDLVGGAHTKEMIYSGGRYSAAEALRMGLVNRVVPATELAGFVSDYAARIAENAPLTLTATKLAVNAALEPPERRRIEAVDQAIAACMTSEDFREGQRAFAEKRRPVFQGR